MTWTELPPAIVAAAETAWPVKLDEQVAPDVGAHDTALTETVAGTESVTAASPDPPPALCTVIVYVIGSPTR
jgi:hypothetical protein